MIKQVICDVCGNYYGIDSKYVISVENGFVNLELENLPESVEGIIFFRNDLVPIVNMRKLFNTNKTEVPDRTQLIYMQCDGICIAFRFDRVAEISEVDETTIQRIPVIVPNGMTAYVNGVIKVSGKLVTVVDHNKLLSKSDLHDLKESIANFKKREEEARAAEEEERRRAEEEARKAAEDEAENGQDAELEIEGSTETEE